MMEPTDRSMPPVMITTVMPSAMMPKGAKLRVMLAALSTVPKVGSRHDMSATRSARATVTQKAWLPSIVCSTVCSLTFATSAMAA